MHINTLQKYHKIFIATNCNLNHETIYIPVEWQIILINEGSFTRNLDCITGIKTNLRIQQKYTTQYIKQSTRNIRCVWLENCIYTKLIFARSLWLLKYRDSIHQKLNRNQPIGSLLIAFDKEIYKRIQEIYLGYSQYLEQKFKIIQPIWGRKCILYYNNKKYAIIEEFFSPNIISFFYYP